jgi:hypothetical protein
VANKRRRISAALRKRVLEDAEHRCSYCRSPEVAGVLLAVDHILPAAAGGEAKPQNLCAACYRCNEFKGAQVGALDPLTGEAMPIFNPRSQTWRDHFAWSTDGLLVVGLTGIGRATISALRLNDNWFVQARRIWIIAGLHPPLG